VRTIERTALVRFEDAEILFEEAAVEAVGQGLHQLLAEERHTRLVVNFGGVSFMSSDVLAILAALQGEVDRACGSITLCGLDPSLRDMLRITRLDGVFDVCNDEADALGLIVR
jgi:anti-sigma B factor antagonist